MIGDLFFITYMKAHQLKIQLTQDGFEKLQAELKDLKENKKPAAVARLSKARSMGDLSENSEYHAAKEELAYAAGRVSEVETILKYAKVVAATGSKHKVSLGSKVKVRTENGEEEYEIVGEFEANPVERKLSATSPIGKALLNKAVGETADISVPAGTKTYTVVEIN